MEAFEKWNDTEILRVASVNEIGRKSISKYESWDVPWEEESSDGSPDDRDFNIFI